MDEAAYIAAVREVLDTLTESARTQATHCFARLPSTARAAAFDIFIDQDGEGFLDIRISLDGPDLAYLANSIRDCAAIVSTRMGTDGLEPPFPLMDCFEDRLFSVHDTLTDTAAIWIRQSVADALPSLPLPVSIASPQGYGTALPVYLA
jgi:hypothetical protein